MWNYLKLWLRLYNDWSIADDVSLLSQTLAQPPDGSNLLSWVLWSVLVVISTLATAIAFLYKAMENKNKTAIDDMKQQYGLLIASMDAQIKSLTLHIEKCDKERLELYTQSAKQDQKIEHLQSEINSLRK
jgi:peptidoglycan hydrolase CwlO-like protein